MQADGKQAKGPQPEKLGAQQAEKPDADDEHLVQVLVEELEDLEALREVTLNPAVRQEQSANLNVEPKVLVLESDAQHVKTPQSADPSSFRLVIDMWMSQKEQKSVADDVAAMRMEKAMAVSAILSALAKNVILLVIPAALLNAIVGVVALSPALGRSDSTAMTLIINSVTMSLMLPLMTCVSAFFFESKWPLRKLMSKAAMWAMLHLVTILPIRFVAYYAFEVRPLAGCLIDVVLIGSLQVLQGVSGWVFNWLGATKANIILIFKIVVIMNTFVVVWASSLIVNIMILPGSILEDFIGVIVAMEKTIIRAIVCQILRMSPWIPPRVWINFSVHTLKDGQMLSAIALAGCRSWTSFGVFVAMDFATVFYRVRMIEGQLRRNRDIEEDKWAKNSPTYLTRLGLGRLLEALKKHSFQGTHLYAGSKRTLDIIAMQIHMESVSQTIMTLWGVLMYFILSLGKSMGSNAAGSLKHGLFPGDAMGLYSCLGFVGLASLQDFIIAVRMNKYCVGILFPYQLLQRPGIYIGSLGALTTTWWLLMILATVFTYAGSVS